MRFVIVTGMSGAGKSTALKMLEDADYFCVDNLPIPLIEKFAQLMVASEASEIQKVALGVDVRSGQALGELEKVLDTLRKEGKVPTLLLHSCCAPCSSYVMEYLSQYFEITIFFYNPNITPEEEYAHRVAEIRRLIGEMEFSHPVTLVVFT